MLSFPLFLLLSSSHFHSTMATFITDKLLHINNDLVQLFHLDTQALLEDQHTHGDKPSNSLQRTQRPSSSKKDTSTGSADHADHVLLTGLRDAVELLDLRSGTVPPIERALLAIQKVEALAGAGSPEGDEVAKLRHLFLAKATATVYLNLLDIILNATLPLAKETEYWQSLLDSSSWRLLYILQSKMESIRVNNDVMGTSQMTNRGNIFFFCLYISFTLPSLLIDKIRRLDNQGTY